MELRTSSPYLLLQEILGDLIGHGDPQRTIFLALELGPDDPVLVGLVVILAAR